MKQPHLSPDCRIRTGDELAVPSDRDVRSWIAELKQASAMGKGAVKVYASTYVGALAVFEEYLRLRARDSHRAIDEALW